MQNENLVQVLISRGRGGNALYEIQLVKTTTRQDGVSVTMLEARYREQKRYYTFYHIEDWKKLVLRLVKELEKGDRFLYGFKQAQKLFVKYTKSPINFVCTT